MMWPAIVSYWNSLVHFGSSNFAALAIDVLLTGLMFQPLCNFLNYGWVRKSEEIEASLELPAKQAYLSIFWSKNVETADVQAEFSALYTHWYGRERYWAPMGLVLLVGLIENFYLAGEIIRLISSDVIHHAIGVV